MNNVLTNLCHIDQCLITHHTIFFSSPESLIPAEQRPGQHIQGHRRLRSASHRIVSWLALNPHLMLIEHLCNEIQISTGLINCLVHSMYGVEMFNTRGGHIRYWLGMLPFDSVLLTPRGKFADHSSDTAYGMCWNPTFLWYSNSCRK